MVLDLPMDKKRRNGTEVSNQIFKYCKVESTSFIFYGIYPYFPTMHMYYFFTMRQTYTSSFVITAFIEPFKNSKNILLVFFRNTNTIVFY